MKKIKLLMPMATGLFAIAAPITTLTGCSKNEETKPLLDQLEETMINEFKQLCKIPHASDKLLYEVPFKSNVQALSDYLFNRVKQLTGATVFQDRFGNIWFDVKYNDEKLKDAPTVAIQAHMDMVFAFDSSKYPEGQYPDPATTTIDIVEDKDEDGNRILHSRDYKTSIGADNGVGVAQILTIISNPNIKHGNLRIIITNCEENAMQGAKLMIEGHEWIDRTTKEKKSVSPTNPHVLDGVKYMLCLDGEHEGLMFTACSGGVGSHYNQEYSTVENVPSGWHKYKLTVDGFWGGHSGAVPAFGFGNALSVANEIMAEIKKITNQKVQLASISTPGTVAYNSVVQKCIIEFASQEEIPTETFDEIKDLVYFYHDPLLAEELWQGFIDMDPDQWTLEEASFDKVLDLSNTDKILKLHTDLGYGVETWSPLWEEELNKTSRNIGPSTLTITDNKASFNLSSYSRSDTDDLIYGKSGYRATNEKAAKEAGVEYLCDAQFHPWLGDSKRDLIEQVTKAWENSGVDTLEYRVHAGLEPSWWTRAMKQISKVEDAQAVTYGPSITDCHKPTEKIFLDTLKDCLKTTMYILENIK